MQKIKLNKNIQKALQLQLWAQELLQIFKDKGRSPDKVSKECGMLHNIIVPTTKKRLFKFQPIQQYEKKNILKEILFTDSLRPLSSAQMECLAIKLEVWFVDQIGREHMYHPDPSRIFAEDSMGYPNRVISELLRKEWITEQLINGNKSYYLTKQGAKLPKVKKMMKIKNINGEY